MHKILKTKYVNFGNNLKLRGKVTTAKIVLLCSSFKLGEEEEEEEQEEEEEKQEEQGEEEK